jgi:thiamine-phosphate pyrophosphorylase
VRGLYPIVDVESLERRSISVLDYTRALLAARPRLLQLRAKKSSARETLAVLRALRPVCHDADCWLFANDRPDLAVLAGCDGIHVGQTDLSVSEVRAIAPGLKVGVSTHDLVQLENALAACPDYVAFGPVFGTKSKENPDQVVGLDGLAQASSRARRAAIPLVAIGGITLERAESIRAHHAIGAVIAALLPEGSDLSEVSRRARFLTRALGGE